ncbi:MAG: 30S ribosomal protein S5 [Promethearchaeota archaeon]
MSERRNTSGRSSFRGKRFAGKGGRPRRGGPRGRRPRDKKSRRKPMEEEWIPKTRLGEDVKQGMITSIDEIFSNNYKIREKEIVDALLTNLSEAVAEIKMVQKQTDAGQQSRFKAVVVVGDKDSHVGFGSGKSKEVGPAIRRAIQKAKLNIMPIKRGCGAFDCNCGGDHSIPFTIKGKSGSVKVTIKPAAKGTGLVASNAAKIALELAGIKDAYVFIKGNSRNIENTVKAVMNALKNAYKVMTIEDWNK